MTFFFVCSVTVTHHYTYRNTAILQDHSHSPKTKQKNSHDFKRITHMGGFKFNELSDDARTCCAYTRSNSLQEQEDTAVYAVNEAAWRSLAAKGVGATGQTSQKRKKNSNVPMPWPATVRSGPSVHVGAIPAPGFPASITGEAPPSLCRGKQGASASSVTAGAESCCCLRFQRSEGKAKPH